MQPDEFAVDAQQTVQEGESSLRETKPSGGATLEDSVGADNQVDWKAEALKYKAIVDRHKEKKVEVPTPQPAAYVAPDAPLTRQDLYRINSRKAMDMVKASPEMAEHAEELRTLYVNRRGQDDEASIFEDLRDAFYVLKARKPGEGPAPKLPTGVPQAVSSKPPVQDGRQTSTMRTKQTGRMSDWYKPKDQ